MSKSRGEVSTNELARRLDDPDHAVLDARPIAAYNGWPLAGEPRGGHLPGAESLPLKWTEYLDWIELVDEKPLHRSEPVTVYAYREERAREMLESLDELGFEHLDVYASFVDEWAVDDDRPLRRLERYRRLVPPDWLADLIRGEPNEGIRDWVICHTHFSNPEDYAKGHVPEAVPLDTNRLESRETWNRRSPGEIEKTLRELGIRRETTVVVYGRYSHPSYDQKWPGKSAGHLAAMRCALLLLYAGVEDVRVLNGGIHTWKEAGYETSTREHTPEPIDAVGLDIPERPDLFVDTPGAREFAESDGAELVSVRSWSEFVGEWSGYHYIDATGRVPGAIYGQGGSDAYHMEDYRNLDYTTRPFEQLERCWAAAGIVPDKKVAFYCGTGWRAAEAFMNAHLMGWPDVSVYDGGWFEWSRSGRPSARGVPGG